MMGVKHLLLLAASVLLARCQQKPQVFMSPNLKQIFSGDLFYLSCDTGTGANTVTWYLNNDPKPLKDKTWKIAVAAAKDSGSYKCESNGLESDSFPIDVQEYIPRASLIIKTGQPVMRVGGSVILQLENEGGLQGWKCWVYRGHQTRRIVLRLKNDSKSLDFQPRSLNVPETIFWCTDRLEQSRSNQIIVRTSEKDVSLEMYPLPAVAGESLTLRCLVWGTDQITRAVFYKDHVLIGDSNSPIYKVPDVTENTEGTYKCNATFTYKARTAGQPYHVDSDHQLVFVQAAPMKAALSENIGLSCSCSRCPNITSFHWYKNDDDGQPVMLPDKREGFMMPKESGSYACRAVWETGMSFLSKSHEYNSSITPMILVVLTVLLILGLAAVAAAYFLWKKKRNVTGPIYEDVGMALREKGDDKYESLQQSRGAQREGEYDTLHPEAPEDKKENKYEALKKGEMKEGVYHTIGMEGAAGGTGGYEALRKEGVKAEVYHTLGKEGTAGGAGGAGGYEALRKEGVKAEVYHTLGKEGTAGEAGGAGGYEALRKEGVKAEVYHTLGKEGTAGEAGGAGGYEALRKEGVKEGVYHTLGMEGVGGGEG
ncbi:sialoadhesin [Chaetodon auriga]|uniref:sialoadhesin n=1 Tax=Chaetodon auriga TaxID=39042 RepID=UPI0040329F2B